jgi:hypothetical protein
VTLKRDCGLKVFEKRMPRRIAGPKRGEVIGIWRTLCNGKLHDLYSSPNILRTINSMRMKWAGHVARMRREIYVGYWWKIQE